MLWPNPFSEPLASTRDEAARYVEAELEKALPKGWEIHRFGREALAWVIAKTDLQPSEWANKEYGVQVSVGLDFLFFTYGNNDVGPHGLHHALVRSLVLDAASVRHFGMTACLEYLMSHYEPNEWGYT